MNNEENEPATVFIVDDDAHIRDSLRVLMEAENLSAAEFESADEFLAAIDGTPHGCLITDLRMPGRSGLELQAELRARGCALPIIVLTAFGDVPVAVRAMKQGAVDFVEKPYQPDELLQKVNAALELSGRRRSERRAGGAVRKRLDSLTRRERQVLQRVAQGLANKVVASELGISERTVEIHRGKAMKKMGVRSVAELVRSLQLVG